MDASIKSITAAEAQAMVGRGELTLFDVRPAGERAIASVAVALGLDAGGQARLAGLDRAAPIAFLCHHGVRSHHAAQHMVDAGFQNVYNVEGGIDAWSLTVDPSIPRY